MSITIRMRGGLGNQMFHHALAREFQHRGKRVVLDLCSYRTNRDHNGFELTTVFPTISHQVITAPYLQAVSGIGVPRINESSANFDPNVLEINRGILKGYWQSPSYFASVINLLRDEFTFRSPLEGPNSELAQQIIDGPSVSLHVRRGDYVGHPMFEGICTADYYRRAVDVLEAKMGPAHIFLFSDDIKWCVKHLELPQSTTHVTWNQGKNSFLDMQLISLCDHHIIANSSFSWWGAWLNSKPGKIVLAPDKWIHEENLDSLVLPEWCLISSQSSQFNVKATKD